ncbi:MAG TPA: response regulator [Thermoanaerobaculia bacterium]|nr:response regulator [Thermoanaerobaculia bacterium]
MTHRDVLVVDDDAATRALLEVLLSRAGLTVRMACDGEEAVEALNDCKVDAIVMDLFMPKMNGTDLLETLTREKGEMLRHVIVLSAGPEALLGETRRKYPIWCAMRKPADISDLMENVLDCMLQPPVSPAAVSPA